MTKFNDHSCESYEACLQHLVNDHDYTGRVLPETFVEARIAHRVLHLYPPRADTLVRCAICKSTSGKVRDDQGEVIAEVGFTLTVAGWTCSGCTETLRGIDHRFVAITLFRQRES